MRTCGLSLELEFLKSDCFAVLALSLQWPGNSFLAFSHSFIHSFVHVATVQNTYHVLGAQRMPHIGAVFGQTTDITLPTYTFGQMKAVFSSLPFLLCLCFDRHMPG